MHFPIRQIAEAFEQYRRAERPLAGALRIASLMGTAGRYDGIPSLFAATLVHHGHHPDWPELRALVEAARKIVPRFYAINERVVTEREPCKGLFIVHRGAVQRAGREDLAGAMTVFGGTSVRSRIAYRHTVMAAQPAVLLHLDHVAALKLFAASPFTGRHLSRAPAFALEHEVRVVITEA